jgi:hypothetical protein
MSAVNGISVQIQCDILNNKVKIDNTTHVPTCVKPDMEEIYCIILFTKKILK